VEISGVPKSTTARVIQQQRATSYSWGSHLIGTKYSSPDVSQLTGIHCIQIR
jgi:hypothetical protein